MRHLLRLISLRHMTFHRARTILTTTGIILGVAVFVAVQILNKSILASFAQTIDDVAGKTVLVIDDGASGIGDAGTGIPESLLEDVRGLTEVKSAVPVIIENARAPELGGADLAVLAVDTLTDDEVRDYEVSADQADIPDPLAFLSQEDSILLTQEFAAHHGLEVEDELDLLTVSGRKTFTVRGLLAPEGPAQVFGGDLAVMDVYAAQIVFGRGRRFDRIDIVPAAGVSVERLESAVRDAVAGRGVVSRPERRSEDTERMIFAFRLGLSLMSMVALCVGVFIIYNSVAISVAQRRREIGILRSLGQSRGTILQLFVLEGLVQGVVGSATGVLFGMVLARSVLRAVGATVSDLYFRIDPSVLQLTPQIALGGLTVGMLAALFASWVPSWQGASVDPAVALRVGANKAATTPRVRGATITGIAFFLLGCVCIVIARVRQDYYIGYAVAAIWAVSAAFWCPILGLGLARLGRSLVTRWGMVPRLGLDSFARNTARNAVTVAALGLALGNVVTLDGFVDSMKTTTVNWFERSIRADVFVFAGKQVKAKFEHPIPYEVGERLLDIEGVEAVNPFRIVPSSYENEPIYYITMDYAEYLRHNRLPVVEGDAQRAYEMLHAGTGVIASETFARQFGVGLGDRIELVTDAGKKSFEVALIYIDYSAEVGILGLDRPVYNQLFEDRLVSSWDVYAVDPAKAGDIRDRIAETLAPEYGLIVLENADYRSEVLDLIDRTFVITDALALVAIIVAVLGIANTLLVTVMDRRREIGILRAIGASRNQVHRIIAAEAGFIALAAAVVGGVLGTAYSIYIVNEVIRFQVGWKLTYAFPALSMLTIFAIAQVAAFAAAWWPARRAANVSIVHALEYE